MSRKPTSRRNIEIELSVVLPCLNEAATVGKCIEKAKKAIKALKIRGEVVVADNGSHDRSPQIAKSLGARVVKVEKRGYGHALIGGLTAARGRYFVMGDADDSYDFLALGSLVEKLKEGVDVVIGNRFRGGIGPGAMPWKNRWIGNPTLTAFCGLLFKTSVGDVCCGFRAMTRDAFKELELETGGMEFAVEMIALAKKAGLRLAEVPVTLEKDGRSGPSHLRGWRDGAATLLWMLEAWVRPDSRGLEPIVPKNLDKETALEK
jgi:glycosyltransferase involved in cell wall biosynthesis